MKKIDIIKSNFISKGMKESNIEYAYDAVKFGTERQLIVENLISTIRNETRENANLVLDALYETHGGEFKYQNRWALFAGFVLLIVGILGGLYLFYVFTRGGYINLKILIGSPIAIIIGLSIILKAIRKKYTEDII
jgi:hypothetical protein